MSLRRSIAVLLALVRKRQLDRELDNEIRAHLEMAEKDAMARGQSAEEARWEARRSFGGIQQMKEIHRDRRSFRWIETLVKDFRYGLASLRRAPGFTIVVVSVLALGIGGTVAMYSVVDAVLLKPLPFPNPDRLVRMWEAPRPGVVNATTPAQFLAWKRLGTVFAVLSAENPVASALTGPGEPRRLLGESVSAEYFNVFAIGTELGRVFSPEEDRPGAAPVVVLSHAAWQTYFGADPGILQRHLILDGEAYQVIGVLRPGAFDRGQTQFWKPLALTPAQLSSEAHWLTVYGRLRAGVSVAQAAERMQAVHEALLNTGLVDDPQGTIAIEPLERWLVGGGLRRSISVAFGAVVLVLLIACANVANLLFAQGATRGTELAVRAALGAGRARLFLQLLTESLALCLLGGGAGAGVAYGLIRFAKPLLSQSLPFTADVTLDLRVLGFGCALAFGVALLVGAIPAFRASWSNLAESLKSSRGAGIAHTRMRRTIVTAEIALSLVLVCGALLLARSLVKLQGLDTGVDLENVVTMSADLPLARYSTPQKAALFYEQVAERLRSAPGVAKAGLSTFLPLEWIDNGEAMQVAGFEKLVHVRFKRVDPGYFGTLGIPILKGRGITSLDLRGTPRVVLINQALAARLAEVGGMQDPIGKTVRLSSVEYGNQQRPLLSDVQIAGIIRSERTTSPGHPDPAVVYVPLAQAPNQHIKILVRTRGDLAAAMPAIRRAIHEVDPDLPLGDVTTMQQVRDRALAFASQPAWLIGAFAVVAVLLTAIGLYGVVAHAVTQRHREFGIRIALGAQSRDVVAQVLHGALALLLAGLVFGLLGVFALTRVMKNLLFEVSPLDPSVLAVACVSMVFISLLAGFLPAHRAARVDPVTTLRDGG